MVWVLQRQRVKYRGPIQEILLATIVDARRRGRRQTQRKHGGRYAKSALVKYAGLGTNKRVCWDQKQLAGDYQAITDVQPLPNNIHFSDDPRNYANDAKWRDQVRNALDLLSYREQDSVKHIQIQLLSLRISDGKDENDKRPIIFRSGPNESATVWSGLVGPAEAIQHTRGGLHSLQYGLHSVGQQRRRRRRR
ncbi:hypothetical protein LTR37_010383 [Vermiconidia calcicola]|uniref:Uncharacterized protein n=1 Tax=Vermiconidia calcicola TaxID=1690605 RepID=A0ACC3N5D0_9PEZI|nr:hypothetical protein LTR37_010383 [Vermiconidia calcicola]